MSKRKRDEYERSGGQQQSFFYDSDEEEPSLGRQILPVANLPVDFDGIPQDGMEYLFTVRRDAAKLPRLTRVDNPYASTEPILPPARDFVVTNPALPSEEWRMLIQERFLNLKKNITQPTIHVAIPEQATSKVMPDIQDRAMWWEFLAGKPESEWNPPKKPKGSNKQPKLGRGMRAFADEASQEFVVPTTSTDDSASKDEPPNLFKPRKPTPNILTLLDERQSLHLLMYFTHWINVHVEGHPSGTTLPRLKQAHAQWIFALLTRVGDFISADDMNLLRNLSRACFSLLKLIITEKKDDLKRDGLTTDISADEECEMDQKSCWIIVSVIVGVWHQRDLWIDAEQMLKNLDMAET
ncbi:hypothetical protein VNI00_001229 [Paramarasmius palmivorus]|uniref:Gem-associated protein 2 n=1 Tax=Paramarasmius palmivorus TaxID=297713 RepID=A0AAW0E940_9AGAR